MLNTERQNTKLHVVNENDESQSTCSNCQEIITGLYCSHCGQCSESNIKYFWTVILHILDDIFSFDSRASRTLWPLLTRPGFLTNEYIQGRRVLYVPPLRLYLFISIIFFISLKFFAASENNNISKLESDNELLSQVTNHISELELKYQVLVNNQNSENQQHHLQAVQLAKQKLDAFKSYQSDLSNPDNKLLKAIASGLVSLEFKKLKSDKPLSDKQQEQYASLTSKLVKARKGENLKLLNIGNNSDGTLSFDFLSAEKNLMLNNFAVQLEEKTSSSLKDGTGPLLQQTISKLPQLMFVLLPLFAALLKIMYLFSNRFYMEHLTVALHSHSFVFISILLIEIIDYLQDTFLKASSWLDSTLHIISIILLAWVPIYLFVMQKRIYKQGYAITFIKYSIVGVAYSALITMTAIVAFVWGIMEL